MARRNNTRRSRRSGQRRIQEVFQDDQYAGRDSGRVFRQISAAQNNQSLCTIVCGDLFSVNAATTGASTVFSFNSITATDDFVSLAAQFNTFRVRGIMFDIYDVNPTVVAIGTMATFHQSNSIVAGHTQANIMDRPDSQLVAPGSGKITLYWRPKGTEENNFQGVGGFTDFGGMSINVPGVTTAATKYQIAMKAIVDFRARQ